MTKQKNKFLTFIFSLIPGCGQMYMGFMKRGLSLITTFALSIAVPIFLYIPSVSFICAIVWFYAFFDSLNLSSLAPERFALVEDSYLFIDKHLKIGTPGRKFYKYCGYALIAIGIVSVWNGVFDAIYQSVYYTNPIITELIYNLNRYIPRAAVSAVIIIIGIKLVSKKKREPEDFSEVITDETK